MIKSKEDLHRYLSVEKAIYKTTLAEQLTCDVKCRIWKYVKLLRYSEYHYNNRDKFKNLVLYIWYRHRRNMLGNKLGFEIWENNFDEGLTIYHAGYIVVNREVRAGKYIQLHGCNCLGNNGRGIECPCIGNSVDFGFGAGAFGDITIVNNIKIGAGAIVVKSCDKSGAILTGVPAYIKKEGEKDEN